MPDTAMPNAIADSTSGGRTPRPVASQSASPEAAIATAMLAATKSCAWIMCALACSALMPRWCIEKIPPPIRHADSVSRSGVSGPELVA